MFCSLTSARTCSAIAAAVLTLGFSNRATAQNAPAPSLEQPAPASRPLYHNNIRLDVGGFLLSNLANSLLNNGGMLAPVMVSYERQVGQHTSLVAEGLLNGGTRWERKEGASVQGRYYLLPARSQAALQGLYVAPVLGYRAITLTSSYQPQTHRSLLGGGVLVGWQGNLPHSQQFFFDASLGAMSWGKLGHDRLSGGTPSPDFYQDKTFYERSSAVIDGRFGLGFRF